MTSSPTTVRRLMDLRHMAHERNEAVEAASHDREESDREWAFASRVWSRQAEALTLAIIGEPATTPDDALSVLICLAEIRDRHDSAGNQSGFQDQEIDELTDVAIQNCALALARNIRPDHDRPETERRDLEWGAKQVARWLPPQADQAHEQEGRP